MDETGDEAMEVEESVAGELAASDEGDEGGTSGDSEPASEESSDEEGDELLRAVKRKYVQALTGKKVRDAAL